MTLEREELRDGWTVTMAGGTGAPDGVAGRTIPATVPGQVHTDLEREGLLPDPTFDQNEQAAKWVGRADWSYRTSVDVDPRGHERVDLVCDGLDTVSELSLDGVVVGTTRNMHRRYRFDARVQSGSGATTKDLEILFESPYREAGRVAAKAGSMPGPYDEPFPYIRKMASNFGWDWGLTAVTSGPWRPVAIERWSTARLREVRPLVDVEAGEGVLDAHITVERSGLNDLDQDGEDDDLVLVVTVSGLKEDGTPTRQRSRAQLTPKDDETVVTVRVPEALRWWPRGYGAQAQYDVIVELQTVEGEVLDRDTFRTGFRSTRIDTQVDDMGRPFGIHVNGTLIDVRGVNWIPDDVIVSRVDRARLQSRLTAAASLGTNLVRVWGGGVYESRDFYEVCDELGLLVWQDFPFACSAYPEVEPIRSEVIAEARDNVARLARHPSLVLWNGNNENIWLHDVDGWADSLGDRGWGLDYYLDLLPTIVDAVDPSRFYTVASPWSGSESLPANDVDNETHHSWDVWNRLPDTAYRGSVPRFVSEFGWQAPPAWRTLRDGVADEVLSQDAPGVVHHQKAADGMGKLARGLEPRFGTGPFSFDAWHYLTQLQQARAIATGIEHWRTHWPRNAGVVMWQLNDLWPVSSWSAIDSAGRLKPLAHELRRLYDDVLLTIRPVSRVAVAPSAVSGPAASPASSPASPVSGAVAPASPVATGADRTGGPDHPGGSAAVGETTDPGDAADTLSLGVSPGAFGSSPVEVAVRSVRGGQDSVVRVRRVTTAGTILAEVSLPVRLSSAGVAVVALPESVGVVDDPTNELIVADMDWRRAVWTPGPDADTRWEPARYRTAFTPVDGGLDLTVEADSLVRDLLVQPDRVAAGGAVDRGFMTLLPGERVTFRITGVTEADVPALREEPVLWSLDRALGR